MRSSLRGCTQTLQIMWNSSRYTRFVGAFGVFVAYTSIACISMVGSIAYQPSIRTQFLITPKISCHTCDSKLLTKHIRLWICSVLLTVLLMRFCGRWHFQEWQYRKVLCQVQRLYVNVSLYGVLCVLPCTLEVSQLEMCILLAAVYTYMFMLYIAGDTACLYICRKVILFSPVCLFVYV